MDQQDKTPLKLHQKVESAGGKWTFIEELDQLTNVEKELCGDQRTDALWVFRGVKQHDWELLSTLDRLSNRWAWRRCGRSKGDLELGLLRTFRRHLHLYDPEISTPHEDETIEWLALMQHYQAPTRLVDFTYSFWTAVFFAFEAVGANVEHREACEHPPDPCVWAVNASWLKDRSLRVIRDRFKCPRKRRSVGGTCGAGVPAGRPCPACAYEADLHAREHATFGHVYMRNSPFVLKQNCWRMNQRLWTQQGVFLCPGDPERTFQDNLLSLDPFGHRADSPVRAFRISSRLAGSVHRRLRAMNISAASVYPGFEGFAKSLGNLAALPELLSPGHLDLEEELKWTASLPARRMGGR